MATVDELASQIYVQTIIRDDISFANPGARLLATKRAEGAFTLAEIFLEVKDRLHGQSSATHRDQ